MVFFFFYAQNLAAWAGTTDSKYRLAKGFVVVYDITNACYDDMEQEFEMISRAQDSEAPVVIVANKIDLEDKRAVSYEEGKKMASKYKRTKFFEISAKEYINIEEAFYALFDEIFGGQTIEENIKKKEKKEQKKDCLMV